MQWNPTRNFSSGLGVNPGQVQWPGGPGWLVVGSGTVFTGTAFVRLLIDISEEEFPLGIIIPGVTHINTTNGLNTAYPFSAPPGLITIDVETPAGGDSVSGMTSWIVKI